MGRLTSEETRKRHEDIRKYYAEGHTNKETAEKFGMSPDYVKSITRGIRQGNQYTSGLFNREANAIRYITERTPGFEYAGNFTGIDGYVDLRCKTCGAVMTRSFVSVKQGTASCKECKQRKKEADALQKEKEKERREKELARKRRLNRKAIQITMRVCEACGSVFLSDHRRKYCSDKCAERTKWKMKDGYRYQFPLEEVYERDHGVCYLCGGLCDWNDYEERDGVLAYGGDYPSRDHVIPKSKGGPNTWDNIRLAHIRCNSAKRDRPLVKKIV